MKKSLLKLKIAVGTAIIATSAYASTNVDFKLTMVPDSERITMPNFEVSLYKRDIEQLYDIAEQRVSTAFGVDAFTEYYRAHMWRMRNDTALTQQDAKMVNYKSVNFGPLAYIWVPSELARCIYNIDDGKLEYTNNYDDVLYYKDAKNLLDIPRFMFERIVLANIFNRIKNKPYTKIEDAANEVVKAITETNATIDKYAPAIQQIIRGRIQRASEKILEVRLYICKR